MVITLPSEPGTPTDSSAAQAITSWPLGSPPKDLVSLETVFSVVPPMTSTEIPSASQPTLYTSGALGTFSVTPAVTASLFQTVPTSLTQFLPAEASKPEVSAVSSAVPSVAPRSVSIPIPPEPLALDRHQYKENGKLPLIGDAIDLRTIPKSEVKVTEKCMDLSASAMDVKRQTTANEVYRR